jgi:hypothetical protein
MIDFVAFLWYYKNKEISISDDMQEEF